MKLGIDQHEVPVNTAHGFDDDPDSLPPFVLPTVASDCRGTASEADVANVSSSGEPASQPDPFAAGSDNAGQKMVGDYELLRELGRGGMGVVYEARDTRLNRRVALKILPPNAVLDPKRISRFQLEAHAVARLSHPHIVPMFDIGSSHGTHFLSMQLIDGKSLSTFLPAERDGYVPIDIRDVAKWGQQAAEALDHAHKMGVVHRDVKPSNLLVDAQGDLWITDFGLAQIADEPSLTLTGDLMGTLRYLSPEQAMAHRIPIDHRTDIYSLGITLYELLTGEPAFPETDRGELLRRIIFESPRSLRRVRPDLPRPLQTILEKAIEKNPADRFSTAQEFADDLRRFLDDEPIRSKPPSLLERAARWSRHNRQLVAVGVLVLLAATVVGWAMAGRLKVERDEVTKAWSEARKSEVKSRHNEWRSLVAQVGLTRRTDRAGRRDASWQLIQQAVELGRELPLDKADQKRLRDEVIACLALHDDLSLERTLTHETSRYRMDFSPLGDRYARTAWTEGVDIHDATGRLEFTIPAPFDGAGSCTAAQFSPSGRWLMVNDVGNGRDRATIWDLDSQKIRHTAPMEPSWPFTDFSHDGGSLVTYVEPTTAPAVGSTSGEVRVIELASGEQVRSFPLPFRPVNTIAGPQPNQMTFFKAASPSTELSIWDITTGKFASSFQLPDQILYGMWSRDGLWLATTTADNTLSVWDALQRQFTPIRRTKVGNYGFSFDSRLLAIELYREETELWDLHTSRLAATAVGRFSRFMDSGSRRAENGSASDPLSDSQIVTPQVALYDDRNLSIYRVRRGAEFRRIDLPIVGTHTAVQAEFSPDSRTLAVASPDGLFLIDVASGRILHHRASKCRGVVFATKDHKPILFCATMSGLETLPISAETRELGPVSALQAGDYHHWQRHLSVTLDGRTVASIVDSTKSRIWRDDNPAAEIWLEGHTGASVIAISTDGRFAVTSAWQGNGLRLWDAKTGRLLRDLWPDAYCAASTFTPDGRAILAGDSRRYRLIDIESGQTRWELARLDASNASGWSAFSPDGKLFAVTPDNAAIHLFDAKSLEEIAVLEQPERSYNGAISFSPDGRWIARCSNQSVELWDLGQLQTELRRQGLDWE